MFNSLRGRFILSHILPLLIVIPMLGVAVIYLVESRFLIPSMLSELEGDARLLSRLVEQDVGLWRSPDYASQLLGQASTSTSGRLMLLDANGMILASSDSVDANRIGTNFEIPSLADLPLGQVAVTRRYSQSLDGEIADALAPVTGQNGQLLGYIRLSYRFVTFSDELYQLRYLLSGILLVSLLLGAGLGAVLAVNVGAPVQQVTQAVDALANGERNDSLPEYGTLETRRLSHSVNVLLERLRGLETARKRLLANLVHEIGRPLGAMRMGIEALSNGAERDPKFYKELLGGMEQESARLQRLLEDLSHLHDQALGVLELDYTEIDLSTWLPQTLAPWGQAAMQKHLHWKVTLPPSISPLHADPLRLGQVLGNLVSNAIKFTPADGTVTISADEDEQQVWLRVRDTGPGIPLDQQKKMFEPFVRGGQGRRFPQGMGLGLSIAQELVDAHGGRLTLESDAGLGATFTVWLRKKSF